MLVCGPAMRTRLAITLACGLALTVAAGGCGSGNDAQNRAQDEARAIAGDIDGVLGDAQSELADLAKLPAVRSGDPQQCSAELKSRKKADDPRGEFTAFGAATADGTENCLSLPLDAPVDIGDRVYLLRALGTGGLGVGDFQIGRVTGITSIGLGYPVSGSSKGGEGIVLAPIDLSWLGKRLSDELDPDVKDLLVTDDHGTVLARVGETKTPIGENLGSDELVQAMLADGDGSGEFSSDAGKLAYGFTTVPASADEIHVAVGVEP
jgi:hypothetical protein